MSVTKSTPLLALLDARWNEFIKGIPDPSGDRPSPVFDKADRSVDMAARAHAEANNADPFAYRRARRYMRQGYWLPSEVSSDARGMTASRRNQGITFPVSKGEA